MNTTTKIKRSKTAIRRNDYSLPVKCLLRDSLLDGNASFFDYGCGHGENLELLSSDGVDAQGWDPNFFPDRPKQKADVVNLGYVINVIEDVAEREETLRNAWGLASRLFVVAAQVQMSGRGNATVEFGDGVVTRIGTFQKYYRQSELREYLETTLQEDTLPAALGVFYIFKDEQLKQSYIANRYRRRGTAPRKRISELRFEQHKELLEPFMVKIAELGRLPFPDEFEPTNEIVEHFGSVKRAFTLVKRVTGAEPWEDIGAQRTEDLLVYLALARFRKRPRFGQLPIRLQRDIRALFKSYNRACTMADLLLFRAGDPEAIDDACKHAVVGKLLPNALYVHKSAIESLEPQLRIYEGCARSYLGEIEDANIVKLHRHSGKVSYLAYPDFDKNPHPTLVRSVKLSLRTLDMDCYDYHESTNPPILHRKESFVDKEYPIYERFARLTRQEENHGLLNDTSRIGTRQGWEIRLKESGWLLRGHRLVRRN